MKVLGYINLVLIGLIILGSWSIPDSWMFYFALTGWLIAFLSGVAILILWSRYEYDQEI